jgi:hypothetical protein
MASTALPEVFPAWLDTFVTEMLESKPDDARNVVKWDKFVEHLIKLDLCQPGVRVNPNYVAVSTQNRSGMGLDVRCMDSHGGEFIGQGFSWLKSADACAIAPLLHGDQLEVLWKFNQELVDGSEGLLPALRGIKIVAIGGTNTNGVLRAIDSKCCTHTRFCGKDGKWDKDNLVVKDANLKDALDEGMVWKVIDPRVGERYPLAIIFGISVMNARSSAQITETEGMLAAYENVAGQLRLGKHIDWNLAQEATQCHLQSPSDIFPTRTFKNKTK